MSKPVLNVTIQTTEGTRKRTQALFDSGSFFTILRADQLPSRKALLPYRKPRELGTAGKRGGVEIEGETVLVIRIGKSLISTRSLVAIDLKRQLIVGAGTMQEWDISIRNRNGDTRIVVGRDLRDPEVTEVD
ncbi:MAG: hypothetical protein HYY13_02935 [Nitrospirae bacterium]|nr:hypothetical protein [Nitrospirota bacterium]